MSASNRLPILADEIRRAHADVQEAAKTAAERAIAAGSMLIEAKELCKHGEWGAWLKAAGVPERSARRYMLLHRAGFIPAIVADLGFATAERYASDGLKLLPDDGFAMRAAGRDGRGDISLGFLSYWWRQQTGVGYWHCTMAGEKTLFHDAVLPVWFLGFAEADRGSQFDVCDVETIPLDEAQSFLREFEEGAV